VYLKSERICSVLCTFVYVCVYVCVCVCVFCVFCHATNVYLTSVHYLCEMKLTRKYTHAHTRTHTHTPEHEQAWSGYDPSNPPQTLQPPWAKAPAMAQVKLPKPPKPISPPPPPPQGFQGLFVVSLCWICFVCTCVDFLELIFS